MSCAGITEHNLIIAIDLQKRNIILMFLPVIARIGLRKIRVAAYLVSRAVKSTTQTQASGHSAQRFALYVL